GMSDSTVGLGRNYLDVCDRASGEDSLEAHDVAAGIRSVIGGSINDYEIEYPCHSPAVKRWFLLTVTALSDRHGRGAVVMHMDITERREAEIELRDSNLKFHQLADNI